MFGIELHRKRAFRKRSVKLKENEKKILKAMTLKQIAFNISSEGRQHGDTPLTPKNTNRYKTRKGKISGQKRKSTCA